MFLGTKKVHLLQRSCLTILYYGQGHAATKELDTLLQTHGNEMLFSMNDGLGHSVMIQQHCIILTKKSCLL